MTELSNHWKYVFLIVAWIIMKFSAFSGSWRLATVFIRDEREISWAKWIKSTLSHPICLKSILICSTHLNLDLRSGLFPWGICIKTLYESLFSLVHATYLTHLIDGRWTSPFHCQTVWSMVHQNISFSLPDTYNCCTFWYIQLHKPKCHLIFKIQ
jgi:hypothetical protein